MTQDNNQHRASEKAEDKAKDQALSNLLDMAPLLPSSANLRDEIIATALLDLAPDVPASPQLMQNILAKATSQTPQNSSAEIIDFHPKARFTPLKHKPAHRWLTGNSLAAGLMAASLVLGIWSGTNGIADTLISAPLELAGLELSDSSSLDDGFNDYSATYSLPLSESAL